MAGSMQDCWIEFRKVHDLPILKRINIRPKIENTGKIAIIVREFYL